MTDKTEQVRAVARLPKAADSGEPIGDDPDALPV